MGGNSIEKSFMMTASHEAAASEGLAFVDTNVFVYAQDSSNPDKRTRALDLIKSLSSEGRIVISTQVLQEYANVAVRKLGLLLPQTNALIDELAKLPVCPIDSLIIKDAVALFFTHKLSFFDSLIIATAARNNCAYLYSEDMADGQTINGVTIVNPF